MSESSDSKSTDTPKWQALRKTWWPRVKAAGKGITSLAALGAAIVAILAWFPLARDTARPELKEYDTLNSLYVGASVSLFDGKLGPASIVKAVPGEAGITQRLYVKKDYIVETLATTAGQTRLYSVLSCNPDFRPSFKFRGTAFTLQDKPLAAMTAPDQQPVELYYEAPTLAGNARYFFEMITESSGASGNRGSGYGVNGICQRLPDRDYSGPPSATPKEITEYRTTTPANFYVESMDWSIRNGANNLVTPFHEDLPPGWPKF